MLSRHFLPFPPTTGMSSGKKKRKEKRHTGSSQRHHPYQQPPVWAGLQPTILLMLELPKQVQKKKEKKKDGEIKALDCRKVTAVFREGGRWGRSVNKRRPNWLSNEPAPPGRRHDSWSWSFLPVPTISVIFPGTPFWTTAVFICDNGNITITMSALAWLLQIPPCESLV